MKEIHSRAYARNFCLSVLRQIPVTYARAREGISSGPEAVNLVRSILATPGLVAIDFETFPAAATWHGEQAACAASRGQQGAARKAATHEAELAGRAHRRLPCVLAVAHEDGRVAVVRLVEPAHELPAMFAGRRARLTAHNAQFETEILLRYGVAADIDCTLLMAKALYLTAVDEDRGVQQPVAFGLADLVGRELGRARNDKGTRDRDWREPVDELEVGYCARDARDALELAQVYQARLRDEGLLEGYRLIAGAILPTASINLAGMSFDRSAHAALVQTLRAEADAHARELDVIGAGAVANHASMRQVGAWIMAQILGDDEDDERLARFCSRLRARCGVSWRRGKTGHLAIRKALKAKMAEALAQPFPTISRYLLTHAHWTKANKLLTTFGESLVDWLDDDGRLRGQLKMGGTVTLRHSASRPNTQQTPRRTKAFRALYVASPGHVLIVADYSQIELRLVAIIAPDEALLSVYRRGADIHAENAAIVNRKPVERVTDEERDAAKPIGFAMVYGGGVAGVAEAVGCSLERAAEIVELFLGAYPGLRAYRERAPREAEALGFIPIRPARRVRYDPAFSKGTQAINYQVQGAAASVQMLALRKVHDALAARPDLEARLVGSIHDEIAFEVLAGVQAEAAAEILQEQMRLALIEVLPEAAAMGADRLAAAKICASWAEKS